MPRVYKYLTKRRRLIRWLVAVLTPLLIAGIVIGILFATDIIKIRRDNAIDNNGALPETREPTPDKINAKNTANGNPTHKTENNGFLQRLVQPGNDGFIFGAHIWGSGTEWSPTSPAEYNRLLTRKAAGFGAFVQVNMTFGITECDSLLKWAELVKSEKAFFAITLEPSAEGLAMMTDTVCSMVADILAKINYLGVPVMLRFAHEMNGNWYLWSQKPALYKSMFIRLTKAIRSKANLTSMVWAPNTPSGYPWKNDHGARAGSEDFIDMDVNQDGLVDAKDDPYTPYWPGAKYVDWIGVSLFHFGPYPFGTNTLPPANKAYQVLTGTALDVSWSLSDFAKRHQRPLGIFEASAIYYRQDKSLNGVSNSDMKRAWLMQLLSPQMYDAGLRLLMWFEIIKIESVTPEGLPQHRDCALFADASVRTDILQDLARIKLFEA